MLAPQRGLIATVKSNNNRKCKNLTVRKSVATRIATTGGILPESSKFDCLPGKAGGTPDYIRLYQVNQYAEAAASLEPFYVADPDGFGSSRAYLN